MRKSLAAKAAAGTALVLVVGTLSACDVAQVIDQGPSYAEGLDVVRSSYTRTVGQGALIKEGVLTVGLRSSSLPPFVVPSENSAQEGLNHDLAAALALQMGLRVEFVSVDDVASSLGTSCDIVMGVSPSEAQGFTVVGDFAETATGFFQKGDSEITSVQDLTNKRVGYQRDSVSAAVLGQSGITMQPTEFETVDEAFAALDAGEVDYVVSSVYTGAYIAQRFTSISFVGTIDSPVAMGIAHADDNTELSAAVMEGLKNIQTNGVGDIARGRWIGKLNSLTAFSQVKGLASGSAVEEETTTPEGTDEPVQQDVQPEETATENAGDGSTAGSNAVTSVL